MNQIDVQRDLLDLNFLLKSDINPEDIKYYMEIKYWLPHELKIHVNFTDPTMISKGMERDTIYMKIKNPEWFRSAETGLSLDASNLLLKQTIPR